MVCEAVQFNIPKPDRVHSGHSAALLRSPVLAFFIGDRQMERINASTDKFPDTFTTVNNDLYLALNEHKWTACKRGRKLYVKRDITVKGKSQGVYLHRLITGCEKGFDVDHINGDTLDNRRENLRVCSRAENIRNKSIGVNNTSGYKGVSWHKASERWRASLRFDRKSISLGYYFCLVKAAKAYDKGALKYFGEYAKLNFPQLNDGYEILETRTYFQHFCRDCMYTYYGRVKDVLKPCPKCNTVENVNAIFEKDMK